jgi:predicted regulator of Ras-like GTPase activity (Roadblock/LC7/MglB family)
VPLPEPPKTVKSDNGNGLASGNRIGNGNGHTNGNGAGKSNGNGQVISQSDRNKVNSGPVLPPFKFTTSPLPTPPAPKPAPAAPIQPPAAPVSMAKPAAAPAPAPKPATPALPTFSVSLKSLSEKWPEEVKGEIMAQSLGGAMVALPLSTVEPGLKRGRVTLAWRDIRLNINPDSAPSAVDDLELDLPLAILAPAFLAAQRKISAQSHARVKVSEEIPNLFFGFPQPETPAAPAPVIPPSAAAPATPPGATPPTTFRPKPLPRMAPAESDSSGEAAAKPPLQSTLPLRKGDTNLYSSASQLQGTAGDSSLFQRSGAPATDFLTRQMQPKDVVARALSLPGVAGAVVALADGLRVAGQVPSEFNADTVAAFLPQIFERVNQSTRELRMGTLNNVSFTVGNVPWKIYRVGSIYFAAFGRVDEHFPKAELAQLAAGLNRKSK